MGEKNGWLIHYIQIQGKLKSKLTQFLPQFLKYYSSPCLGPQINSTTHSRCYLSHELLSNLQKVLEYLWKFVTYTRNYCRINDNDNNSFGIPK